MKKKRYKEITEYICAMNKVDGQRRFGESLIKPDVAAEMHPILGGSNINAPNL